MRQTLLFPVLLMLSVLSARADVLTDKAMSKIARDTKTYISAETRAATEDEAYEESLKMLTSKVTEYFQTERNGEPMPDAVYLSRLSSIYERLTSQISEHRYRVMLYVRKADLMPMGSNTDALLLSRSQAGAYEVVDQETPRQVARTAEAAPTPVARPAERSESPRQEARATELAPAERKPLGPTLSAIVSLRTRDDMSRTLQTLRKSNRLGGASAFPIGNALDYYVSVIEGDRVVGVLHCLDGKFSDVETGQAVDVRKYSHCAAYWFTLPQ